MKDHQSIKWSSPDSPLQQGSCFGHCASKSFSILHCLFASTLGVVAAVPSPLPPRAGKSCKPLKTKSNQLLCDGHLQRKSLMALQRAFMETTYASKRLWFKRINCQFLPVVKLAKSCQRTDVHNYMTWARAVNCRATVFTQFFVALPTFTNSRKFCTVWTKLCTTVFGSLHFTKKEMVCTSTFWWFSNWSKVFYVR